MQVNSSQIQTSDRKVFNSLQKDLYEFINNTKWTNAKFSNEERIECSILINVRKKISNDEYELYQITAYVRFNFGLDYEITTVREYYEQEFDPYEMRVQRIKLVE